MAPNEQINQFRLSESGLEPVPADGPPEGGRSKRSGSGFGDTRKVVILGGLLAVGVGVVAFQFLRGRGPQKALAMPTGPSASSESAVTGRDFDAVMADLDRKMKGAPAADELSVASVERLVREFDGFVRGRQVAASDVRGNPFVVRLSAKASPEPPPEPVPEGPAEPGPEERERAIRTSAKNLAVGSILVGGPRAMAVINGRIYEIGDTVAGFRVGAIEPSRVLVDRDGVTVELCLFEAVQDRN